MTFALEGRLGLDARKFISGAESAAGAVDTIGDAFGDLPTDAKKGVAGAERELGKVEKGADKIGRSAGGKLGKSLVKAFGAIGVGALLTKGIADSMEFDRINKKVAGQFRLTERDAQIAGETAGGLYADGWGRSMEDVMLATARVNRQLETSSGETVEQLTEGALAIAQTWDEDVSAVIRSASQLMENDLADSATHALDIITTGLQGGANEAGDFLDTIDEYSQHWAIAGLSGEQAINQMVAGIQNGQRDVDKIGDSVKEMSLRIREGAQPVRDALTDLGLDADDIVAAFIQGGPRAAQAFEVVIGALQDAQAAGDDTTNAVAILGTQYEDMGARGLDALAALNDATLEVKGSTADLVDTVEASEWDKFKRRAEVGIRDGVEMAAAKANDALDNLAMNWAIHQDNMDLAEWIGGGQEAFDAVAGVVRDFDRDLLANATTWDEARDAAMAHTSELLESEDTFGKVMTAAEEAALTLANEWSAEQRAAELATAQAAEAMRDQDRAMRNGAKAADAAADSVDDLGDEAADTADELDDVRTAWDLLTGELNARKSLLNVSEQFDRVQDAAQRAAEAQVEGGEEAERAIRDHEMALIDLQLEVGEYASEVLGLPDEQVTRIVGELERSGLDEVERILGDLARGVSVPVRFQSTSPGRRFTTSAGGARFFHDGTRSVPGRRGDDVPAIVAAGETILPTHKMTLPRALESVGIAPQPVIAASSSRSWSVTVNHYGPGEVVGSALVDEIRRYERHHGAGWREREPERV